MRSLVSRRLPSWIKFPAVFLAPFVVAVGSWHLVPGQVEIRHWHALVSGSFTCAGLFALFLLFETSLGRVAKFVLAAVIAVAFLYLAFLAAHIP